MDQATTISIGLICVVIGCFVGLAGWMSGRDGKIATSAKWQGIIEGKIDSILGIRTELNAVKEDIHRLGEEVAGVKKDAASAHRRLDEFVRNK